jgi:hypothetical protein
MGTPNEPSPAKLFLAIMHHPATPTDDALDRFSDRFGPVDFSYGPVSFIFTDYYAAEMGAGLVKRYMTFERPIDPGALPEIKHYANGIEAGGAHDGRRVINLDPGYMTNSKLVLASTKDFFHRLYLSNGIHGEITLAFRKGAWCWFSWTYPDYREPGFLSFLTRARASMVGAMRKNREDRDAEINP